MDTLENNKNTAKLTKVVLIACAILFAIFISGLQYFVLNLPNQKTDQSAKSDGIVVITGGQQRLDTGLHLLASGVASKLLISGVGTGLNKAILATDLQLNKKQREMLMCCAELEFSATDTRENAIAARKWMETNKLSSFYLVTANYHMPRSRLAFEHEMPHIRIYYWPVNPDDLQLSDWWKKPRLIS